MHHDEIHKQNRGDPFIDTPNFNLLVDASNRSKKLWFDDQFFTVESTPHYLLVSVDTEEFGDENAPYHFEVVQDDDFDPPEGFPNQRRIKIRGGYFFRHAYTTNELDMSVTNPGAEFGAAGGA